MARSRLRHRWLSPVPALVAALAAAACTSSIEIPAADLAITGATVIDVTTGSAIPDQTVVIEGDRIVAVAPAADVRLPEATPTLDGAGRYVIPGLWDLHVHAWGPSPFSEIFLAHGITAVREMGTGIDPQWGGSAGVWDWRQAVRDGELQGPRVFAAGFILNGGAPEEQRAVFFKGVQDPASGREWVDTLADRGADFIKVYSALAPDTFEAIAERAAERGLHFAGHVPSRVGTRRAVAAGQRSLEHLYDMLVATSSDEEAFRAEIEQAILDGDTPTAAAQTAEKRLADRLLATHDPDKTADLFARLQEADTWLVPTLILVNDPRCPDAPMAPLTEAELAALPGFLRRFVELRETDDEDLGRACRRAQRLTEMVIELEEAGVRLLAGSDSPNPGSRPGIGLHDELAILVDAGLTPARVLQMATRDAAEFMGVGDRLGVVEAGRLADLVVLDADPLADIAHTRRIAHVIANGALVGGQDDPATTEAAAEGGEG